MNLFKEKKSNSGIDNHKAQTPKDNSTIEWLPIEDIVGGTISRKDGYIIAALSIQPINIDLLSEREIKRIISGAHEAINGLQISIQIVSIGRPVDLDGYIKSQNNIKEETQDMIRKRLLQGYIKQAAEMASGGDVVERKFYILMADKKINTSRDEIINRLKELSGNLMSAGLITRVCEDRELINLNFMFMHPAQAAYERAPNTTGPYLPSQLERRYVING